MKFEIGKKYIDGEGTIWELIPFKKSKKTSNYTYKGRAVINNESYICYYRENGIYGYGDASIWNLIKEYKIDDFNNQLKSIIED